MLKSVFVGEGPIGRQTVITLDGEDVTIKWADAVRIDRDNLEKCLADAIPMLAEASILTAEAEYQYDKQCQVTKDVHGAAFEDAKEDGGKVTDKAAEAIVRQTKKYKIAMQAELNAKRTMLVVQAIKNAMQQKTQAVRSILYREQ